MGEWSATGDGARNNAALPEIALKMRHSKALKKVQKDVDKRIALA